MLEGLNAGLISQVGNKIGKAPTPDGEGPDDTRNKELT
jgi:hypothetical protein